MLHAVLFLIRAGQLVLLDHLIEVVLHRRTGHKNGSPRQGCKDRFLHLQGALDIDATHPGRRGQDVRQPILETVADLDPQFPVIPGDDDQHAVVSLGLAESPRFGHAQRERLNRLPFQGRHGKYDDLVRRRVFVRLQEVRQPPFGFVCEETRQVHDATRERRYGLPNGRLQGAQARQGQQPEQGRPERIGPKGGPTPPAGRSGAVSG